MSEKISLDSSEIPKIKMELNEIVALLETQFPGVRKDGLNQACASYRHAG